MVYEIECFREIYELLCCLEFYCSFDNSTDCQNMWVILLKAVQIFQKSLLNFESDTIEKQCIININSFGC